MPITAQTLDLISLCTAGAGAACALLAWRRARVAEGLAGADGAAGDLGGERATPRGLVRTLVGPFAARLRPTSQADLERLSTRLARAGRRHRDEIDRFLEEKVISLLGGFALGFACAAAVGGGGGFLMLLGCLTLGVLGADKLVDSRGAARSQAVAAALPSGVDLLVTCLDAGLSLEQAIARVAKDIAHSDVTLAEELAITAKEFDAGVSLPDALRRLSRRVGLDDLSAMCGVVAQAHSLGAPIAQTLREYAIASRRQRMSILEERAGKLASQLTIPLAVCLLPAAMLMILGPAAVQLVHALAQ